MNNLFSYATKELSQDAMFCWLVNWLNYEAQPKLYELGAATMDLFLGEKRQPKYNHVEVLRQFHKIDVLILFNDSYALILEDKTNTSEHDSQIIRYKEALEKEESAKFKNREVLTAYVKTGIMYDADFATQANTEVTLQKLLHVLKPFAEAGISEILRDYVAYLQSLADERKNADKEIACGKYAKAFQTRYGQFSFLDRVFDKRSKAMEPENIDYIYPGTNKGGDPWTQYWFWGQQYLPSDSGKDEYHYLFWRIDYKWERTDKTDKQSEYERVYYLALRHYDENAHSKNEKKNERKGEVYGFLRKAANKIKTEAKSGVFQEIGTRENYKESDLLFIEVRNLSKIGGFEEIKAYISDITEKMRKAANEMKRL